MEQVEVGKYQPYPEYKDSGVEWVGDMPHHWQTKPAFAAVMDQCIKNSDGAESNVLSLSYGNIVERDVENNFGLLPESFNTYQIVNPGDIVLRLTDLQNDKRSLRVARSTLRGIITSAYLKLACGDELDNRYAYRLLHSYDTTKVFYGMGGGLRQSMKFEDFRRLPFLLPPVEEQRTIAAFLDYETARIDKLIAQQQRLIELLKEKRQAVISHAVTKGLNPDAPMKDSGVEWLGEVPELWGVGRIGYYCRIENGTTPSKLNQEYWSDGSVPWLSSGAVNQYEITEASEMISVTALSECSLRLLPKDTLVVGMIGQGKTRGMSAITRISASINQNLAAIIPNAKISSDFLHFVLQAAYVALRETGRGGNQAALNCELISDLRFAKPDLDTQLKIVRYLKNKCSQFDKVTERTNTSLELLQERRTALISAAVTGKIDLRYWAEPIKEVAA